MLKYQTRAFRKHYPQKWWSLFPLYRKHLDFKKFVYKDGHKIYTAPSEEIRELFKKEQAQFQMWEKLNA